MVCGKSGQVEKRSSSQYSSPQIIFRIVLLFDANKLDISDEFRRSIEAIHGYEDKVRIVLNKADQVAPFKKKKTFRDNQQQNEMIKLQVDHQELMRVYGALMWSISKV